MFFCKLRKKICHVRGWKPHIRADALKFVGVGCFGRRHLIELHLPPSTPRPTRRDDPEENLAIIAYRLGVGFDALEVRPARKVQRGLGGQTLGDVIVGVTHASMSRIGGPVDLALRRRPLESMSSSGGRAKAEVRCQPRPRERRWFHWNRVLATPLDRVACRRGRWIDARALLAWKR